MAYESSNFDPKNPNAVAHKIELTPEIKKKMISATNKILDICKEELTPILALIVLQNILDVIQETQGGKYYGHAMYKDSEVSDDTKKGS